jgi:F0F1-type ATP synthase membrane subunit a
MNFFVYLRKSGDSLLMSFMLMLIEIVSEFSRPFSLTIRLFVNIAVGHSICVIGFFFYETCFGIFFLSMFFILMESFVFFIQRYIFYRLVYMYLGD